MSYFQKRTVEGITHNTFRTDLWGSRLSLACVLECTGEDLIFRMKGQPGLNSYPTHSALLCFALAIQDFAAS